jgi:lipopolysaccharide/colanic/teichoic acid biosynthesis glycosyltransferase
VGAYLGMHRRNGLYLRFKRFLDIGLTLASMPLVAPILLVSAVAIKLDSRGPVLFVQERFGQHGRVFRMYKLRTMVANAEELKAATLDEHTKHFKTLDDPRITRVGKILRKTSIDELPQLFNVLRGDMSIVGPRPTSLHLVEYEPWHAARLEVRPGLTGPWQIDGRNQTTFDERVLMDIEYIQNLSLLRDLKLMARTVGVVVKGKGA